MDLQVVLLVSYYMTLYCDNNGAVVNSKKPKIHKRAKHVERKYHLIRDIIKQREVIVHKMALEENLYDPFMKVLSIKSFEGHLID